MRHKQYFGVQHPSETVSVILAPTQRISQSGSGYSVVVGAVVLMVVDVDVEGSALQQKSPLS